jgi:hypothetical protein
MFQLPGFFIALQQQPISIRVPHVAGRLFSKQPPRQGRL